MGKQLMNTLAVVPYEVTVYRTVENDKDAAVLLNHCSSSKLSFRCVLGIQILFLLCSDLYHNKVDFWVTSRRMGKTRKLTFVI